MLEGASIVCFAHDWGGDPTSKTHIMRILARRNRVLWVNSIAMRRPMSSKRDLRRLVDKLRRSFAGCVEVEPNLWVTNPLVLPLPGIRAADWLNARILRAWLRHLSRGLGFERLVLWTFLPYANRLARRLGEQMVVYHCVDEYAAFSGVPRQALIGMERDLIRRSDVVFASSEQLYRERRLLNPNTHFIPHGVDVAHFVRALDPATAVPDDLRVLPRPVIGFFGLLADWVDLGLVRELALARPDWTFALVGKATTALDALTGVPNIRLLGQKPYSTLPGYCRGFDVGIIPFRINELTLRANPLKLREYLAAGLPVVSTPLPEALQFGELVRIGESPDAFVSKIEECLQEDPSLPGRRMASVRKDTWASRAAQLAAVL